MTNIGVLDKDTGLSWDRLVDVFDIYPETGEVFWRNCPGKKAKVINGSLAGDQKHKWGYVVIGLDGRSYKRHRLIWFAVHKKWPKADLDHRDRDRKNDSIFNLREATRTQNMHNAGLSKANKSGYKGVSWDAGKSKWRASIKVAGKQVTLGRFKDIELAIEAHRRAVEKRRGAFGRVE